jgi:hypothetical protein
MLRMPLSFCAMMKSPPAPLPAMMRMGADACAAATKALVKGLWMTSMALLISAVMASPGLGMNLSWTLRPSSLK